MKIQTALSETKGKKLLLALTIMLILLGLTSCSSENKNERLLLFTDQLNNAESIEYNGFQNTKNGESKEKKYINVKYTKTPFSLYQKMGTYNDCSFVILEHYLCEKGENADYSIKTITLEPFDEEQLTINENGEFTIYPALINNPIENSSTLKGDEKQLMVKYFDQMILYDISYLIEKNIDTFKGKEVKLSNSAYMRYDGIINEDSVLERYSYFGREIIKSKMKMLGITEGLKNNASKEEMKMELTKLHDQKEIVEGIYELVFAEEATPISIWIPIDNKMPYKITMDYSDAYKNKNITLYNSSPEGEYEKTISYSFLIR